MDGKYVLPALMLAVVVLGSSYAEEIQRPASFIVNGVNATQDRYPYYVSLRSVITSPLLGRNSTAAFQPFCGGTLISDRLVLTAAHCVMPRTFVSCYSNALPSTFTRLGLNVTGLPNTYAVGSCSSYSYAPSASTSLYGYNYTTSYANRLNQSAFIGAQSRGSNDTGIPISAWFVHPYYDNEALYYDVAVGLLERPVPDAPKVKLFSPPGDVYEKLSPTANITVIGLGNIRSSILIAIEQAINRTTYNPNNDTTRRLQETTLGTLIPRKECGRALTAHYRQNLTDGSSNLSGSTAYIISAGQMCVGPAGSTDVAQQIRIQSALLAATASERLNSTFISSMKYTYGIDPTKAKDIASLLPTYNDTCQGDSGGPIIIKGNSAEEDVQLGTVSYGVGCGSGIAGVYNSVQAYLNGTSFDSFLLDVMNAVPSSNGTPNTDNLVASLPGVIQPEGAPPAASAQGK